MEYLQIFLVHLAIASFQFQSDKKDRKCDIKVIILLYNNKDSTYLGYIPNDQTQFVDCIREVIKKQKTAQAAAAAGGAGPSDMQQVQQGPVVSGQGPPPQMMNQGQIMNSNQFANTMQSGGTVSMAPGGQLLNVLLDLGQFIFMWPFFSFQHKGCKGA